MSALSVFLGVEARLYWGKGTGLGNRCHIVTLSQGPWEWCNRGWGLPPCLVVYDCDDQWRSVWDRTLQSSRKIEMTRIWKTGMILNSWDVNKELKRLVGVGRAQKKWIANPHMSLNRNNLKVRWIWMRAVNLHNKSSGPLRWACAETVHVCPWWLLFFLKYKIQEERRLLPRH